MKCLMLTSFPGTLLLVNPLSGTPPNIAHVDCILWAFCYCSITLSALVLIAATAVQITLLRAIILRQMPMCRDDARICAFHKNVELG
eukprot:6195919-Pleurochrysis_carterae.AAC.4